MSPDTTPAFDATTLPPERTFLGHPIGLSILFGTEMWERFCYYGMRALLTFYMVDFLFLGDRPQHVLGYGAAKAFFESFNGKLDAQPLAALVYGAYTAAVYASGLIGGWLADSVFGQRRAVIIGAITMATGEFLLMRPELFFIGLIVLVAGNGFFKPNISTQVGGCYRPGDSRIDRAYSIFYVGINLGALIAPLITGRLGHAPPGAPPTWDWGFGAAGIGMLIGLGIYLAGQRQLPPDIRKRRQLAAAAAEPDTARLTGQDRSAIIALVLVAIFNLFFWGCYEQQGITIALMAERHTNLGFFQPEDVQSFNPFFIFTLTPLLIWFWARQSRSGSEPSSVTKMAMGSGLSAASFALLLIPAGAIDAGHKVSVLWLIASTCLLTVGELYLSPVALALFSKAAPAKVASLMMAVNFMSNCLGNYLAGYLGSFWEGMSKTGFFAMLAAILGTTSLATFVLSRLVPVLKARERAARTI